MSHLDISVVGISGSLQLGVAYYALRLNRRFGTVRVGWSLFSTFLLLALLHFVQSATGFLTPSAFIIPIEAVYILISSLLIMSLAHLETVLTERVKRECAELRMKTEVENKDLEVAQNEETLAQTEHLFSSFMDNVPDRIFFKDKQCRFIRVNRALANWFGQRSPADLQGKTDVDFFSEEHARAAYNDELEIIRTGQPLMNIEERETRPDRPDVWVLTSKIPLRNGAGEVIGLFGISREITETKLAREQIHEQYRLLDLASDAIIVRDMEDRILYWNKGAEHVYGWTAKEASGQKTIQLLHEDLVKNEEAKKIILETGNWNGELTVCNKNAQEVIVDARWTLVRDPQGRPKSILGISTDVTEKKRLETQFLRSRRLESIGTLASGVAHDLNNVLTPLLIGIQLLKSKMVAPDTQKLLDNLEANVMRGAKLTKQVLVFGRGVTGERKLIKPELIVREIEEIVHETFPKSIELETRTDADLWPLTGDATQLYQVLLNLCVNARDAMPNGGKLSIHLSNVTLNEVHAKRNSEIRPGPYVVAQVSDTGSGISKEVQSRLFEPFFTTKGPSKGTGLGLSTTYGIVKSHGGFINCYSELGKGTAFNVYLPANTIHAAAEGATVHLTRLPRGNNELVLLVDDEESIREVTQKTLEHFGFRVLTAVNGAEAVSIYKNQQPEIAVVLTDMSMPVMDGLAASIALRSINPDVKIIAASGLSAEGEKVKEIGIQQFVSKPYTAEVLLDALHQELRPKLV